MKIPFDIKYRPQIESGECQVETKNGVSVRIICWDAKASDREDIIALVGSKLGSENCQRYNIRGHLISDTSADRNWDLYIITDEVEEELSDFEKEVCTVSNLCLNLGMTDEIKSASKQLLSIAREQFAHECGWDEISDKSNRGELYKEYLCGRIDGFLDGKEVGKSEALKELKESLSNDDIYRAPEWLREVLVMAKENGKNEALKDLPRWKKAAQTFGNYTVAPTETGELCLLIDNHFIMLSDIEKLPGFEEEKK